MTTGALISFILYALLVARGFRNASRFTAESLRAVGATQWIFELLERTPLIPLDGGAAPADLDGSIALEQVRFRYPTRPDVEALRGVDLQDRAGRGRRARRQIGIRQVDAAQSAFCASTIPTEGRVLVGGRDVRELNPASLRSHIATVMQEPTLFSRTVADNIGYGVAGGRRRPRSSGPRRWRAPTSSSSGCPAATPPPSAIAAFSCPAASGSGWRSPAPSCGVRRS